MMRRNKKRKKEYREKASIQDASNTARLEQEAMRNKMQKEESKDNPIFDVREARRILEEFLKGFKTKWVKDTDQGGNTNWKPIRYFTRKRQILNEVGAEVILEICNTGALNRNTISSYLPGPQIKRKVLGTMGNVYDQIIFNHDIYGIAYKNTADAGTISSTTRNVLIDSTAKARGGRSMKAQEQMRIIKEAISREESDEDFKSENKGWKSLMD